MEKSNMSYTKFKKKVLDKLADYKKNVLKIKKNCIFHVIIGLLVEKLCFHFPIIPN